MADATRSRSPYISPSRRGSCSDCGCVIQLSKTSAAVPRCARCRSTFFESLRGERPTRCAACGVAFESRSSRNSWTRACSKSCSTRLQMLDDPERFRAVRDAGNVSRWGIARRSELEQKAAYERKNRARRARRVGTASEPYTTAEIAERDGFRCGICRRKVRMGFAWPHPSSPSIDHIVPLSKGGEDTRANVQLAHLRCNLKAGASFEYAQQLLIG